jgi:hypothetical protein
MLPSAETVQANVSNPSLSLMLQLSDQALAINKLEEECTVENLPLVPMSAIVV